MNRARKLASLRFAGVWQVLLFGATYLNLSWPGFVFAELDDNCVVSALNRSSRVGPDGSWHIFNVPANFGRVRMRATCAGSTGAVTQIGNSDFSTIRPNV